MEARDLCELVKINATSYNVLNTSHVSYFIVCANLRMNVSEVTPCNRCSDCDIVLQTLSKANVELCLYYFVLIHENG